MIYLGTRFPQHPGTVYWYTVYMQCIYIYIYIETASDAPQQSSRIDLRCRLPCSRPAAAFGFDGDVDFSKKLTRGFYPQIQWIETSFFGFKSHLENPLICKETVGHWPRSSPIPDVALAQASQGHG